MGKNKKDKKPLLTTKHKVDNSIEVQVNKNPGKTLMGKIAAWLIIVGTICVPLATLIWIIVLACK